MYKKPTGAWCRVVCLLLALTVVLFAPVSVSAVGSQSQSTGEMLRVGYSDYNGFLSASERGRMTGYASEYLRDISALTGWEYAYVYGSWEENLERLYNGELDLLCSARRDPVLEDRFEFSSYDAGTEYDALYVSNSNKDIYYEDFESFDGMRVGLMGESGQLKSLTAYAQENAFTFEPVMFDTCENLLSALRQGKVDAVACGSLNLMNQEKVVAKFSPCPFYFITQKGNHVLMDRIDSAMEKIWVEKPGYNGKLYEKYYGGSENSYVAFTREEADYIKNNPVLDIVYDASWEPVEYTNKSTGEAAGIAVDILKLVEKSGSLKFNLIPAQTHDEARSMLKDGRAKLILGHPEQCPEAQEGEILLTQASFTIPLTAAKRRGELVRQDWRIAIPQNSMDLMGLIQQEYPLASIKEYPTLDACLKAVSEESADIVFDNKYRLERDIQDLYYTGLETAAAVQYDYPLCIGMEHGEDPVLLSLLNKLLSQISEGERMECVVANTMAGTSEISLGTFIRRNATLILFLMLAASALVIYLIVTASRRSRKALERYAFFDSLTGLHNLTRFKLDATKLAQDHPGQKYALVEYDIDKFKMINDLYGVETGNQVLRKIAARLKRITDKDSVFCRSSNDDFLVLMPYEMDDALCRRLEDTVNELMRADPSEENECLYIVSCGAYRIETPEQHVQSIHLAIDRAGMAHRAVKEDRMSSYAFYTEEMRENMLQEKEIEDSMYGALERREFVVYYQPKCSIADGSVVGAEALVRWRRADGSLVPPDRFIPVLEKNGFVVRLDLYVFEEVCRQLHEWRQMGIFPVPVSVNLSRVHLRDTQFIDDYRDLMNQFDIPSYLIELELTESVMFDNQEKLISMMRQFHAQGFNISMDDFGSGYSSLNLLKDLPLDVLKLDREFFAVSSNSERGKTIISSVVQMARELGIVVVSEGVETKEQVDFLREVNCDVAQGYYFSRPLAQEDFFRIAYHSQAESLKKAN